MKLEAKFRSEKNVLYFLDGTKAELNDSSISANEEFLADLRDQFKSMEENDTYGFVVPVCDAECGSAEEKENFVASMKHCARRIKDCENIIGFAIPAEADVDFFMEELSAKHKHYIYFTKDEKIAEKNESIVKF